MKVILYEQVKDFLDENKNDLLEHEAVCQLLLYNAMIHEEENITDEVLFGKIISEDGAKELIFCNVLPYNLLINHNPNNSEISKDAVITIADYILDQEIRFNGLNTNKTICDLFIERCKEKKGMKFVKHLAMDVMELRQLESVTLTKGHSRLAQEEDLDTLIQWEIEFAMEALEEKLDPNQLREKVRKQIGAKIFYLFVNEEEEVVSMAAASRKLINGVSINYVFTPKKHRGKGYAMTNMYYLSDSKLKEGNTFCSLFVDKENPISNHVYKKIGYHIVEDNYDYRVIE